jgi:hypothetical protein
MGLGHGYVHLGRMVKQAPKLSLGGSFFAPLDVSLSMMHEEESFNEEAQASIRVFV